MPRSPSVVEADSGPESDPVEDQPAIEDKPLASHEGASIAGQIMSARFSLASSHHQQRAEIARDQILALNLSDDERSRLRVEIENHDRASQICQWLESYRDHQQDQVQAADGQNEVGHWAQQSKIYDGSSSLASLWASQDKSYKDTLDSLYDSEPLEAICDAYWEAEEIDLGRNNLIEQEISRYTPNGGDGPDNAANRRQEIEAHYEKLIHDKQQAFWNGLRHLGEGHDEADRRLLEKITNSRRALEFLANPNSETSLDDVVTHFANLLEIQACAQSQEGNDERAQELQKLSQETRRSAEMLGQPDQDHEQAASQFLDGLWQYQVSTHRQLIPEQDQRAVAEVLEPKTSSTDKMAGLANYWSLLLKTHLKTCLGGIDETGYGISIPNEIFDSYEPLARDLRARISRVESLREHLESPDSETGLAHFATAMLTEFTQDMHACTGINAVAEPHECSNCSVAQTAGGVAYSLPHPTKTDASLSLT